MTRDELRQFLLSFEASVVRVDEANQIEVFEVEVARLRGIWREKLARFEELGDFERQTGKNILTRTAEVDENRIIFAILHDRPPLQVEMRVSPNLSRILRERYESVVPSKLMSEREWLKVIGFGQVQPSEVIDLLRLSYRLTTEGRL